MNESINRGINSNLHCIDRHCMHNGHPRVLCLTCPHSNSPLPELPRPRPPLLLPLTFSPLLYFYSFLVTHILYLHHPSTCTLHPPIPYISLRLSASIFISQHLSTLSLSSSLLLFFMSLLSLIGIHDPPRPGVARAVADLQQSHVAVVMITGDALVTASTIGTQVRKHILHTYFACTAHVLHMYCTRERRERDGRETLEYRCDVLLS